jgi:hypothetical protein
VKRAKFRCDVFWVLGLFCVLGRLVARGRSVSVTTRGNVDTFSGGQDVLGSRRFVEGRFVGAA